MKNKYSKKAKINMIVLKPCRISTSSSNVIRIPNEVLNKYINQSIYEYNTNINLLHKREMSNTPIIRFHPTSPNHRCSA